MRKIMVLGLLTLSMLTITGCVDSDSSKNENNGNDVPNNITLKFIQHSYVGDAQEVGYYFRNDELATTELTYQKGTYLDSTMIDSLYGKINHIVPKLNGDGYYSFTFFTKDFDQKTGLSSNFLKEQTLEEDMTIHFAIYG